jgi:hypothetical protein
MILMPVAGWAALEPLQLSSMTSVEPLQRVYSRSHWTNRRLFQIRLKALLDLEGAASFRRALDVHIGFERGLHDTLGRSCSKR